MLFLEICGIHKCIFGLTSHNASLVRASESYVLPAEALHVNLNVLLLLLLLIFYYYFT